MKSAVKFQRRHFEFMADALNRLKTELVHNHNFDMRDATFYELITHFADELEGTNPQFDRQKFIDRARGVKIMRGHAPKIERLTMQERRNLLD